MKSSHALSLTPALTRPVMKFMLLSVVIASVFAALSDAAQAAGQDGPGNFYVFLIGACVSSSQ